MAQSQFIQNRSSRPISNYQKIQVEHENPPWSKLPLPPFNCQNLKFLPPPSPFYPPKAELYSQCPPYYPPQFPNFPPPPYFNEQGGSAMICVPQDGSTLPSPGHGGQPPLPFPSWDNPTSFNNCSFYYSIAQDDQLAPIPRSTKCSLRKRTMYFGLGKSCYCKQRPGTKRKEDADKFKNFKRTTLQKFPGHMTNDMDLTYMNYNVRVSNNLNELRSPCPKFILRRFKERDKSKHEKIEQTEKSVNFKPIGGEFKDTDDNNNHINNKLTKSHKDCTESLKLFENKQCSCTLTNIVSSKSVTEVTSDLTKVESQNSRQNSVNEEDFVELFIAPQEITRQSSHLIMNPSLRRGRSRLRSKTQSGPLNVKKVNDDESISTKSMINVTRSKPRRRRTPTSRHSRKIYMPKFIYSTVSRTESKDQVTQNDLKKVSNILANSNTNFAEHNYCVMPVTVCVRNPCASPCCSPCRPPTRVTIWQTFQTPSCNVGCGPCCPCPPPSCCPCPRPCCPPPVPCRPTCYCPGPVPVPPPNRGMCYDPPPCPPRCPTRSCKPMCCPTKPSCQPCPARQCRSCSPCQMACSRSCSPCGSIIPCKAARSCSLCSFTCGPPCCPPQNKSCCPPPCMPKSCCPPPCCPPSCCPPVCCTKPCCPPRCPKKRRCCSPCPTPCCTMPICCPRIDRCCSPTCPPPCPPRCCPPPACCPTSCSRRCSPPPICCSTPPRCLSPCCPPICPPRCSKPRRRRSCSPCPRMDRCCSPCCCPTPQLMCPLRPPPCCPPRKPQCCCCSNKNTCGQRSFCDPCPPNPCILPPCPSPCRKKRRRRKKCNCCCCPQEHRPLPQTTITRYCPCTTGCLCPGTLCACVPQPSACPPQLSMCCRN